jgi:hypothetical protein
MVMGDGFDTRLGYEFGQRKTQWHVHGDGQAIFGDQHVDVVFGHKCVESVLKQAFDAVDLGGERAVALVDAETVLADFQDDRVLKMGFFDEKGAFGIPIQFPCEIITGQPFFFENAGPFFGFQGDPVRSGDSGRNESHIVFPRTIVTIAHGASSPLRIEWSAIWNHRLQGCPKKCRFRCRPITLHRIKSK